MMATGYLDDLPRKAAPAPRRREFARLAFQLRQFIRAIGYDKLGRADRQIQQWAVAACLFGVEAELVVEITEADRLQIEKPADGETTCHRRFVHQHRGKMAAGRPAADIEPRRIASQRREILMEPMQRGACLANNSVHRSRGCQGVARDRDMVSVGEWSLGNEAEALLGVTLPIAAVEEQQGGCAGTLRGEEIKAGARRIAINQIEMIRHAGAKRLAAALPIGEIPVAICDGSGVVISGVERLPIHTAVNNHAVPLRYWTWLIARASLVPRVRLRQKLAGAPNGSRARSVAVSPACRDV